MGYSSKGTGNFYIIRKTTMCDSKNELTLFFAFAQFSREILGHLDHVPVLKLLGESWYSIEPFFFNQSNASDTDTSDVHDKVG